MPITDEVDAVQESARQTQGGAHPPPNTTRFGAGADVYAFTASDLKANLRTFSSGRRARAWVMRLSPVH